MQIVLSHVQARVLSAARKAGLHRAVISPDLGLTTVEVRLADDGIFFPNNRRLSWDQAELILSSQTGCFLITGDGLERIKAFSEMTNRAVSLMPTSGAPTILLAGFPMHRIKDIEPMQDTRLKVAALKPVSGRVLDTATGLGYTAIEAARTAEGVLTIELDPAVIEIAHLNPWSRALFEDPKIECHMGDSAEIIASLELESFDRILHDPPTFSLAGDLYGMAFYRVLFRVLKPGGRLFHYVGDLESRSVGRIVKGVIQRLERAGFQRIQRRPEAFGLVARR